ncbi:MAG: hypothetical protein MRJ65_13790 [Candidatus Brocadiaceae bacterium]|nr:hypothetical protein [Candidatus Brocadiaceae bacterium]
MRPVFFILLISVIALGNHLVPLKAQEQPKIQEIPVVEEGLKLEGYPLQIWTFIDDYRIITGKTFYLTVQVMWKLGLTVHLEGIDKIDLHPFVIQGVTIGKRQIFDNEFDYQIITYALSLPADYEEGIYTIPSFTLSYMNEVNKTEGSAISSPVTIKKVPILMEGKLDRDVITIGDHIHYTLTIWREKEINLLKKSIETINFSPFEILKVEKENLTEGDIEKTLLHYTLSIYELGGKKRNPEIPAVSVLYYKNSRSGYEKENADEVSIETKEVKTAPQTVLINSLLKSVDVSLEGAKGPMNYSGKYLSLHGYLPIGTGASLLVFLGVIAARAKLRKRFSARPKVMHETPQSALKTLEDAIASFQYSSENMKNRENVCILDKALRIYLGRCIDIPMERALSTPTANFIQYVEQKQLSEGALSVIKTVLKQLDDIIFGNQVKEKNTDKVLEGIEKIIQITGVSQ